jgi:hypothetical protein
MVANFSELRKAEVQLPRRPSATTTFVRPLTLSLVGATVSAPRLVSLDPGRFSSSITSFRNEDLEAHRRVFCTLNG